MLGLGGAAFDGRMAELDHFLDEIEEMLDGMAADQGI
jgi:hypothetical protein